MRLKAPGRKLADRALEARGRVLLSVVRELEVAEVRKLERLLATLLDGTTVDRPAARQTCRLCDAHVCGHYDGECPVTGAADRRRAYALP